MKRGLLADSHEHTESLRQAIAVLKSHGVECFVVLGDVFEQGKRMEETVALLQEAQTVGVWGNHDFGLCITPDERMRRRYSSVVLRFMDSLQPRCEIDGCLFTHVEPWIDPHKIEYFWCFEGPPDSVDKLARSFAAVPQRLLFIGHVYRWLIGTPEGLLSWQGDTSIRLDSRVRHLVVVHAVCSGRCALLDTETSEPVPFVGLEG